MAAAVEEPTQRNLSVTEDRGEKVSLSEEFELKRNQL